MRTKGLSRGTVIGVGVVVLIIIMTTGQWAVVKHLERQYQAALYAERQLILQREELRAQRDRIEHTLSAEQQRSQVLSATLSAKDHELQQTVARLTEEQRTIHELQGQLASLQGHFDQLQGELAATIDAQSSGGSQAADPQMVRLEKVVVTQSGTNRASAALQGHVVSVHPEWHFVVIDLGWDAVKIGDIVQIYRNDQLLGKARIERAQEQVSAATLLPESNQADVQVNDVVRIL